MLPDHLSDLASVRSVNFDFGVVLGFDALHEFVGLVE